LVTAASEPALPVETEKVEAELEEAM